MYPGAVSLIRSRWTSTGGLVFEDLSGNAILTINPSTGGILLGNAGGLTVSTGILNGLTISSGATINSSVTVSSGRLAFSGQLTRTVTADATLAATTCGAAVLVTASDVIITLPGAGSSGRALAYTIYNATTTAGQVVIKTTTSEVIIGGIGSTGGVSMLANTGATHLYGDYVTLINQPASTSWAVLGLVGTWASTT